jgi:16S rRNA (uracil1498-N3)-methyltransferase
MPSSPCWPTEREGAVTREWRRLLVGPERLAACAGRLPLLPEETHYLRRVLRLRGGEQLALLDGIGRLWTARLALPADGRGAGAALLEQPLDHPLQQQPAARPVLELAVALPRLDGDVLLRMACELGVDRFTPLQAARSVAADRLKPQRQQAIVREAVEQCERLWLPSLSPEQPVQPWLARPAAAGPELRLLATTRRPGLQSLAELLGQAPGAAAPGWIRIAIGPEGGWTAAEEEGAAAAGWQPVSLGDTILRTSTAAVLAVGWLTSWRGSPGHRAPALSC